MTNMTKYDFERFFWGQYLILEQEFVDSLNYIEFDTSNFAAYSNKYVKLLLQIGSEVDNTLKEICNLQGRTNISQYATYMLNKYPQITNQSVKVINRNITLIPFTGWNTQQPAQSLCFWDSYNLVKHDRIQNLNKASLETVSNGLAALFIIEIYQLYELYKVEPDTFNSSPDTESQLFILENWTNHIRGSKVKLANPLMDDEDGEIIS